MPEFCSRNDAYVGQYIVQKWYAVVLDQCWNVLSDVIWFRTAMMSQNRDLAGALIPLGRSHRPTYDTIKKQIHQQEDINKHINKPINKYSPTY